MKLITEKGQLPIPEDLEISIDINNPFFSEEGASSIPITLPASQSTLAALGYPTRIGTGTRLRKLRATLSQGVLHKTGSLLVDSASEDGGITCSFLMAESEYYSEFKEKGLREIFSTKVREEWQDVNGVYSYLQQVLQGSTTDDFTVCPVAVDYDEDNKSYKVNNYPLAGRKVEYLSRYISDGDDSILVPDGYGLAPFLYLHRLIDLLFELGGYQVTTNAFREDEELAKIIMLHTVSDVVCPGKIEYSDLVPDITVSDLLQWLHDKFLAAVQVDPDSKTVDVLLLQDVLAGQVADADLTDKVDGAVTLGFSDPARVVLKADTSLKGAAPASETIEAFCDGHEYMNEVNESTFNGSNITKYCTVKRLATGDFYSFAENSQNINARSQTRLGSNVFDYDKKTDMATEEFSPADPIPPMVFVDGVLMPYVGGRTHRHTQVEGKSEGSDGGNIMIAYDRGLVSSSDYRLATTQAYDASGTKWTTHSLMPDDLYLRFFSLYNGIISAGKEEMTGRPALSEAELQAADVIAKYFYKGKLLLMKSLSFSMTKNKLECGDASFMVLKNVSDLDKQPTFKKQSYYWKVDLTAILTRLSELEEGGSTKGGSYSFDYPEGAIYPAQPPTSAGQRGYYQTVQVMYTITDDMLGTVIEVVEEEATIWYTSYAI